MPSNVLSNGRVLVVFITTLPLSRNSPLHSETEQFHLIALMFLILYSKNLYQGAVYIAPSCR